jgi:hypothetical protein
LDAKKAFLSTIEKRKNGCGISPDYFKQLHFFKRKSKMQPSQTSNTGTFGAVK